MREEISREELISKYGAYRDGHSKHNAIMSGMTGIISMIASSLLIVMLLRSKKGISTTQNRLLLGLSISDLIYSSTRATFNSVLPSDVSYGAWNARGNLISCCVTGYMSILGGGMGLLYNCSLNFYYLLVVKYTRSDEHMKRKIEPYLHAIPILYSIVSSTLAITFKNLGNSSQFMACNTAIHNPPHCHGYELGETREGYEQISCKRGSDGIPFLFGIFIALTMLIPPVFISGTFVLLYQAASKIDKKKRRYGSFHFRANIAMKRRITMDANNNIVNDDNEEKDGQEAELGNDTGNTNNNNESMISIYQRGRQRRRRVSKSTWIMRKAFGYAIAYFLTWAPFILHTIILQLTQSDLPIAPLSYIASFFNPLQGFFTFLNYVYFRILNIRTMTRNDTSYWKAFCSLLFPKGNFSAVS